MSPSISESIRRAAPDIIRRWEEEVRASLPKTAELPRRSLRDHVPMLLDELADELGSSATPAAAGIHGKTRFEQGIALPDVLEDLAILRRTTVAVLGTESAALHDFFDRSMRAAAEASMHAETEFRDRILGILSHDLRNPLGAVSVGIELVLLDKGLQPAARRAAERVASSAARMLRMIRDLLDLSRVRSPNGLPLRREEFSADDVIADVVEELRLAHPGRDVELRPPPEPVVGAWDRDRLAQLLSNLLSNAFEHGTDGGPVAVEWSGGGPLRLSVVSAGAAIDDGVRARIFDAFQRGEAKKNQHGLGLGLYIVREIARAHGGDVALERSDGVETRFTVTLP